MNHYKDDPRRMISKFNGTCAKCKQTMPRGSQIYYWPKEKKAYCENCGETDYRHFLDSAMDESMYSGTPYESHDFGDDY